MRRSEVCCVRSRMFTRWRRHRDRIAERHWMARYCISAGSVSSGLIDNLRCKFVRVKAMRKEASTLARLLWPCISALARVCPHEGEGSLLCLKLLFSSSHCLFRDLELSSVCASYLIAITAEASTHSRRMRPEGLSRCRWNGTWKREKAMIHTGPCGRMGTTIGISML